MNKIYIVNLTDLKNIKMDYSSFDQTIVDHLNKKSCFDDLFLSFWGYYSIQTVLKTKIKIDFSKKPKIINGPFFNLTHSKNYIAFFLSDEEVGIDIEIKNRHISDALLEKCLCDEEKKFLPKDKEKFFLSCWVKKEAYLKFLGDGINTRMENINSFQIPNCETLELDDIILGFCYSSKKPEICIYDPLLLKCIEV